MDKTFSGEITLLKALAIMLVVSGHLEFSIFGMFPPYSFQLALFFFISGMLFKDKYIEYIKSETDKFNSRFHMNIYADELFLLELYRKIEKRGFKVLYDNEDIEEICSISCIVDVNHSIKTEA